MFNYSVVLFYPCITFKEVNLVNRRVWVDKNLTSQRSLSRKLLKEVHEEASQGSYMKRSR